MKAPCMHCEDRRVTENYNCHSDCERYEKYLNECIRIRRERRSEVESRQHSYTEKGKLKNVRNETY